jgi:hypothetical protein
MRRFVVRQCAAAIPPVRPERRVSAKARVSADDVPASPASCVNVCSGSGRLIFRNAWTEPYDPGAWMRLWVLQDSLELR